MSAPRTIVAQVIEVEAVEDEPNPPRFFVKLECKSVDDCRRIAAYFGNDVEIVLPELPAEGGRP